MGVDEDGESKGDEEQLQQRRRPRQIHQRTAFLGSSEERHKTLHRGHQQRQYQSEMSDLDQHSTGFRSRA